jgi:hypothetical protein
MSADLGLRLSATRSVNVTHPDAGRRCAIRERGIGFRDVRGAPAEQFGRSRSIAGLKWVGRERRASRGLGVGAADLPCPPNSFCIA